MTGGRVAAIAIESGERILSTSTRLRIAYSEGATGALPPKLFLPSMMIARTNDPNGFTLIHGDPNWNNILVPHNADRPLYIIDRQPFDWSLTVWLGVYDLAYALVLDWDIDERRRFEIPILRHYHDRLTALGVYDYSWEQLLLDYRLSVPICVYVAIEWCRGGVNEPWVHIWLPMLQQAMTACDDLNCRELWG